MSNPNFINELVEEASVHTQPLRKRRLGFLFWLCVGWIALNILGAIFANVLPLINPTLRELQRRQRWSLAHHLLGTDDLGRDIFSRIVFGSRVSIEVSLGAMLIGFGIGAPLGMLAAYRRGKFDAVISTIMYVVSRLSGHHRHHRRAFVLDAAITAQDHHRDRHRRHPARLPRDTRGHAELLDPDFVVAAKVQGATDRRILMKELLPNVAPVGVSFLLMGIATVVTLEGALAFLGLSVNPPTPSWGNMINESLNNLQVNPWLAIFPSARCVSSCSV